MATEIITLSSSPVRMSPRPPRMPPSASRATSQPHRPIASQAAPIPEGASLGFQSAGSAFARFALQEVPDQGNVRASSYLQQSHNEPLKKRRKLDHGNDEVHVGRGSLPKPEATQMALDSAEMMAMRVDTLVPYSMKSTYKGTAPQSNRLKAFRLPVAGQVTEQPSRVVPETVEPRTKADTESRQRDTDSTDDEPLMDRLNAIKKSNMLAEEAPTLLPQKPHKDLAVLAPPVATSDATPIVKKKATVKTASDGSKAEKKPRKRKTASDTPKVKKPAAPKAKPASAKAKLQRSPAKKAVTITDLAIAQAMQVPRPEDPPPALLNVQQALVMGTKIPLNDIVGPSADDCQTARDDKVKTKKKTKKSAKEPVKEKKLPSPTSAIRRIEQQDVIFGTSSQIRHEDTQYLLDVETALKASEADDPSFQMLADRYHGIGSRSLWSVSNRDDDDALLLPEIPQIRAERRKPEPPANDYQEESAPPMLTIVSDDTVDIDDAVAAVSRTKPAQTESLPPVHTIASDDTVDIDDAEEAMFRMPSAQKDVATDPPRLGLKLSTSTLKPKLHHSSSFSITPSTILAPLSPNRFQSVRPISTSAAKQERARPATPTKGRFQPIAEPSITADGDAIPMPRKKRKEKVEDSTAATKRPRGRPPKDAAAAPADISKPPSTPTKKKRQSKKQKANASPPTEDIEDDEAPTPSPRRRPSPSMAAQLELTGHATDLQAKQTPAEAQEALFSEIAKIIKSAPPTGDAKAPSWYEKILLYDPIVLEDITSWLNTQGVEKGPDGKALKPAFVQKWCESQSICCLWREGLRGGVKKNY